MYVTLLKAALVGAILSSVPAFAQTSVAPTENQLPETSLTSIAEQGEAETPSQAVTPPMDEPTVKLVKPASGSCPLPPSDPRLDQHFNLNRDVILCHAALAPLPQDVPSLLSWLKRPDVCGKGMKARPKQACAIIFAALDDRFPPSEHLRPMTLTRIHRIIEDESGQVTAILAVDPDGAIKQLRPDNFQDLFIAEYKSTTDLIVENRRDKRFTDKRQVARHCSPTKSTVHLCPHYIPVFGLGLGENDVKQAISQAAVKAHYSFKPKLEQDIAFEMEQLQKVAEDERRFRQVIK